MGGLHEMLSRPLVVRLCQIAAGIVMAVAGLAKVGDLGAFAEQIHNFRLVPVSLENLVAIILPWIELVLALALILGIRARAGGLLSLGLLVSFTVAVALAQARGLDIECGCFGKADATRVGWGKILQNLGFIAVTAVACLRPRGAGRS